MKLDYRHLKSATALACVAGVMALSGCGGTLTPNVTDEGTAEKVVFPDVNKNRFDNKNGTFPNVDNIRMLAPGMTRDELYELIGRPHFSEGFKVREWDYLFNFRTPSGVIQCQMKVLFDKKLIAQSYYWKPEACFDQVKTKSAPAPAPAPVVAPVPVTKKFSLKGDVLFPFDSAVMTAAGRTEVKRVADEIKAMKNATAVVSGHTDLLGNAGYNQALSQRRAQAVAAELASHGVPPNTVQSVGRGENEPVTSCDAKLPKSALIACLQPNRRVDISVTGIQ